MIKANLIHLSYNMWRDRAYTPADPPERKDIHYVPHLRFDDGLWREIIARMAEAGMNMVILDLGDAVQYQCHPEIAIDAAWPVKKLKDELASCRAVGLEPIPKLNFSACHDIWLGEYSRMLSTKPYYQVCGDLINEVIDLFDGPRFFHLGMDEETWQHQTSLLYAVIRQGGLWWDDLNSLVERVESRGSRAWVWSDVLWNCDRESFQRNMPTTVVQSNWYYGNVFPLPEGDLKNYVRAYDWLEEMGYKQVPTGSTWNHRANYPMTVEYCTKRISKDNLLGFMMTPWRPTTPEWRQLHLETIEVVCKAHQAV